MLFRVEVTGGIVRAYADDAGQHDPFLFAVPFIGDEGQATFKGAYGGAMPVFGDDATREAFKAALRPLGFSVGSWRRRRSGRPPHVFRFPI